MLSRVILSLMFWDASMVEFTTKLENEMKRLQGRGCEVINVHIEHHPNHHQAFISYRTQE